MCVCVCVYFTPQGCWNMAAKTVQPAPTFTTHSCPHPRRLTDKLRANFHRATGTCCCGPFVPEKFSKHNCKIWAVFPVRRDPHRLLSSPANILQFHLASHCCLCDCFFLSIFFIFFFFCLSSSSLRQIAHVLASQCCLNCRYPLKINNVFYCLK